ncbi:N-acetylmuramic acid 6-phosphate etherase [Mycoplasmopsis ciconiae]|uniref:N-acetylmuramic acid 6-phosphate etherase n=1 Tax=Mycoplasmopsis ciconiae TaxID=561067 RepID=A0ABU7MLC5_9BACT|nr:N-acetylmuramic acid 6-phosphate etherase [Mycoplasmopsis ciconiae]
MDNTKKLNTIDTEQNNPNSKNFSSLNTIEMVDIIINEDAQITQKIAQQKQKISQIIDLAYQKVKFNKGRLIYIGAGTSGRIGILDASEIYPTYGVKDKVLALIAGGQKAITNAYENVEDDENQAIEDLKNINFNQNDILVGLAASGRTPYVVAALKYAKKINAACVSIANTNNALISKYADIFLEINTGAEVITGSTRMKAGTSQKMICNIISTSLMTKLGYVEQNYMINLIPSNKKLVQRCKNIIKIITDANDQKIDEVFEQTKNVKMSIIMLKENVNYEQAKKIYEEIYE